LQSKYDSVLLRSALNDAFGTKKLGDAVTRLVLPAVDLSAGRIVVMKTPHLPHASSRDRHYGAVDAVLSTTAAPTYFPHASITTGSSYCDGGLWANNPTMVAYAEAMKIRECCKRTGIDTSFEPDEIWVLSVGTGITNYSLAPPRKNAGLGWWAPRLLNTTLLSQSQGTEALANYMIGSPRHHRVNFALPDESWKLDCVDRLDTLKHIGYRTAHEQLAFVREQFLYEPAVRYTPFGGEPALSTSTK
jgi:patatin-like phospholipase/acyl hydrolase